MRSEMYAMALAAVLVCVGAGCESSNTTVGHSDQNQGYAGGDGAFGEDPVQPGEHSRERFNQSRGVSADDAPVTQPSR